MRDSSIRGQIPVSTQGSALTRGDTEPALKTFRRQDGRPSLFDPFCPGKLNRIDEDIEQLNAWQEKARELLARHGFND